MSNRVNDWIGENLDIVFIVAFGLVIAALMVIATTTVMAVQSNERTMQSFANSCAYSCQSVGKTIKSIEVDDNWVCNCQ